MTTTALINARIIDCTGADPVEAGTVIVEGDSIKEVLEGSPGSLPTDAQIIDCRGQTLVPGLIDGHVHMAAVAPTFVEQQRLSYPSVLTIRALAMMKDTLEQGFTTVRDCGGIDAGFRIAVREGLVPGPRLFVSGAMLSQTGGHADGRLPTETYPPYEWPAGLCAVICDGVTEVRRAAREQIRRGVDFIKIMAGGGAMSPSDEIDTSQYSPEEIRAIVFEAESAGTYVSGHCYSDRSITHCLEAGVRTIEHGNLMSPPVAMAMKEAGAILVPTIVTYEKISSMGKEFGIPENNIRKINQAREKALEALDMAFNAGVTIGSGSDLLGPMQAFKATELELQARIMGTMGALIATTATNAAIIGQERRLGTIEAGKLADLILVDGDPLKDITVFQRYRTHITVIMQGGSVYRNLLA